jgi:hypothetical protein
VRPLRAPRAGLQAAHERRNRLVLAAAAPLREDPPVAGGDRAGARRVSLAGRVEGAEVQRGIEIAEIVHPGDPDSQFSRLWRRE